MLSATIIDDDLSRLMNNLSPLELQIWLYCVSIVCADLSPLINGDLSHLIKNLSHLTLIMIYPTLLSGPYLVEPQPSENVRVGKACNLQAVKLKISHCIVLITKR